MSVGVRYLNKEEYEWWDAFIDNSPQGFVFAKSWWLKTMSNDDFKICIYEGDGEIFAGIPLPYFKSKHIRLTPLTQSLGFLFMSPHRMKKQKVLTNQKEHTRAIINFIKRDLKSINLAFHYNYDYWSPLFWEGFTQTTRYTFCIDYNEFDSDHTFKNFSKGHKWILNKVGKKSDLKVEVFSDLELFYHEAKKTYTRQGVSIRYSLDLLKKIDAELVKHNARTMFRIISPDGNVHAVNYIIHDKSQAYYWLGASDSEYRNQGGHTYLVWHTILYFSDKTEIFNFGGSMLEGVEKNFRNFSGEPKPYYVIKKAFGNYIYTRRLKDATKLLLGKAL